MVTSAGTRASKAIADEPEFVIGSNILVAVGRAPNTHDLGLETTGIWTDEPGYIKVERVGLGGVLLRTLERGNDERPESTAVGEDAGISDGVDAWRRNERKRR